MNHPMRVVAAAAGVALLTGVTITSAMAAPEPLPAGSTVTVEDYNELVEEFEALRVAVCAEHPASTYCASPPPPAQSATTVALTVTPGDQRVTLAGKLAVGTDEANGIIYSHGGPDQNGNAWTNPVIAGTSSSVVFDKLVNGREYTFTAQPARDGVPVGTPTVKKATPGVTTTPPTTTPPPPTTTPPPPPPSGTAGAWLSGGTDAKSASATDTSFGQWRGRVQEAATTWSDTEDACRNQWQVNDAFSEDRWQRPLIIAIGGKWDQSWQQAATGGMDGIWRECLTSMKEGWGSRPQNQLYISLFHEGNGNWYDWSVAEGDLDEFKAAFRRFDALQEEILPDANLIFAANADHVPPGDDYDLAGMFQGLPIDVVGVDIYSMHNPNLLDRIDQIATNLGKPWLIQEWATKHDENGGASWVQAIYDRVSANAGTGAGRLIMENYFDLWEGEYQLEPNPSSVQGAARYRQLW